MKKIASFTIDHTILPKGIYLSRVDGDVDTFDIRMRKPNVEQVLTNGSIHTIEHLCATFLRNSAQKDDIVYVGPMGCRTGCYLVMFGDLTSRDVYDLVIDMCDFVIGFEGDIPGASPIECGNYSEQNLNMAKYYIKKYKKDLQENKNFEYK